MFFALFFLLGLEFAIEFEVDKVGSKIILGDVFVGFEERDVFAVWFLGDLPLFFFLHVDLLGV